MINKLNLNSLVLVCDDIAIATEPFAKDSFFTTDGPIKLFFDREFKELILSEVPDTVQAFQGKLMETRVNTGPMYDSDILNELGNPQLFSPGEFAAIIRDLIARQPHGGDGTLSNNGCPNIFHVQLKNGCVRGAYAYRKVDYKEWVLGTACFPYAKWYIGHCIFSQLTP